MDKKECAKDKKGHCIKLSKEDRAAYCKMGEAARKVHGVKEPAAACVKPVNPDEYNGWTNRETWAYSLWLSNEQAMYEEIRERMKTAIKDSITGKGAYFHPIGHPEQAEMSRTELIGVTAEALKDYLEELKETEEHGIPEQSKPLHSMMEDIGSDWRIDYFEIAENEFGESIDNIIKAAAKQPSKMPKGEDIDRILKEG